MNLNYAEPKEMTSKNGTLKQKSIERGGDMGDGYYHFDHDATDLPKIGETYFVYSTKNVGPNCLRAGNSVEGLAWDNDRELIENGMGGNMDSSIKKFHGWRGTTSDNCVCAYGVRKCIGATMISYKKTCHFIVEFGPDLVADKE